tara:strand:+ start:731 stop:937 length:207 start_codon:yes stop_codon:yes gene_type:complete
VKNVNSYNQDSPLVDLTYKKFSQSRNIVDINILLNRVRIIEKNKKNKKIILLSLVSVAIISSGLYFSF